MARSLTRIGVSPNTISMASMVAAALAALSLTQGWFLAAAACIQLRLLCNLLDGMVAIEGGQRTASGEIYNDFPDRISDALILAAAGHIPDGPPLGPELGWAAAYLAVLTAYVRVLGGACGLPQSFAGPMAKPQRMALVTIACIAALMDPRAITLSLILVIAGTALTVALRLRNVVRQLESRR